MKDADYGRVVEGRQAQDALAIVTPEVAHQQQLTDLEAYSAISRNALTPELAVALWHKKCAMHTLERRLTQKATQGVSSARRIAATEASDG